MLCDWSRKVTLRDLPRPAKRLVNGVRGTRLVKRGASLCYKNLRVSNTVSRTSKIENRRLASRQAATEILRDLVAGKADAYEGYRQLHSLWCANNAALQELRPLFRMDGIEPDGRINVTEDFRKEVLSRAMKILALFLIDAPKSDSDPG